MAQQTAVEWLVTQIPLEFSSSRYFYEKLEKALQIEKQQIINACEHFAEYPFNKNDFEDYYNETYNQ